MKPQVSLVHGRDRMAAHDGVTVNAIGHALITANRFPAKV
jgi:hypothetical protein